MHHGKLGLLAFLILSACDTSVSTPDTVFVEPEIEVTAPYALDLDSDGADDLALGGGLVCTRDVPVSSCASSLVLRVAEGAATLYAESGLADGLEPGTEVGPYPDIREIPSGTEDPRPFWSRYDRSLASIHRDMIRGTSQPVSEAIEAYYGIRVGSGEEVRYGWVKLSARAVPDGEGLRFAAVVHAYALGIPNEIVRVGERP
ncbi:MAG: hypothetical protein ABJF88_01775 [Rhodothermales bacterium]